MAVDRSGRITADQFTGSRHLFDGNLASLLRGVAQEHARRRVVDIGAAALIDNSGGTDNSQIEDVAVPVAADTSSADGFTPASFDAAALTVLDAYATIIEKCNALRPQLGMGTAPEGPGTPGGGTIAAITVALTGATGDASASVSSVRLAMAALLDRQATTVQNVREMLRAVGLADPVLESDDRDLQGSSNDDLLMPAIPAAAAVAAGTSATTGVSKTATDAALVNLADNVAYMATLLDSVTQLTLNSTQMAAYAS